MYEYVVRTLALRYSALTDEVCWVVVQGAVQANTAEVVHHCISRTAVGHLHRGRQGRHVRVCTYERIRMCVCVCVCVCTVVKNTTRS